MLYDGWPWRSAHLTLTWPCKEEADEGGSKNDDLLWECRLWSLHGSMKVILEEKKFKVIIKVKYLNHSELEDCSQYKGFQPPLSHQFSPNLDRLVQDC